jgi:hypothetical protein
MAFVMFLFSIEAALSLPLSAAITQIKTGTSTFTMSTAPIILTSIKPASELGAAPTVAYATAQVNIDWISPATEAALSADNSYSSPTPQTRTISPVWTWTFTLNNGTRPVVTTSYTVKGANNQTGVFSNTNDPTSTIAVSVNPAGVAAVNVGKTSNNKWQLTEAADISFTFANIKKSGTYSGTIQATITSVNFQ